MRIFSIMIIGLTASILSSCTSDQCEGNRSALPLAGFYSSYSPLQSVMPPQLEISGLGAPNDSLLINKQSDIMQCYLPFRIDCDSTQYRLTSTDSEGNTLSGIITFRYDIQPYFVSQACGVVYNFKIRSISSDGNLVDSVAYPSDIIDNTNIENLRIYLRIMP